MKSGFPKIGLEFGGGSPWMFRLIGAFRCWPAIEDQTGAHIKTGKSCPWYETPCPATEFQYSYAGYFVSDNGLQEKRKRPTAK